MQQTQTFQTSASGHILVHDGSDSFDNAGTSGDATLAANALTISAGAVDFANAKAAAR